MTATNYKMKSTKLNFIALLLCILWSTIGFTDSKAQSYNQNITLQVESTKESYILGEIVLFNVEVKNQSEIDTYLYGTDVESGYLHVLISQDGYTFKRYSNGTWGHKNQKGKVIKPLEVIKSTATVLSNVLPGTSGLSDSAILYFKNKQLMTIYAFPKSGDYYLKAVLVIPNKDGNIEVSSEPLKITITEPIGEDFQVWKLIKDRGDFAHFIQNGQLVDFKNPEKQAKFLQDVEEILNTYPNSFYASSLRQSLDKFKASEAKLLEFQEKIKAKP
jgi:hypothetical protein